MKPSVSVGLLVLRVGIGAMFMAFGFPKLQGGIKLWTELGGAMGVLGISFAPALWGFMAALAEFGGGLALVLGVFVRPFAALMAFTMAVAALMLVKSGAPFQQYAHAVDMLIVFAAVVIGGGGPHALGPLIRPLSGKWYQ